MDEIPYGYCHCGCGQKTRIVDRKHFPTDVIGEPRKFIRFHQPNLTLDELKERFWNHVDIRGPDECWLWKSKNKKRRPGFSIEKGKVIKAPRAAYIFTHGSIPDELEACHTCDNPPCCNPAHIFAGTHQDNMDDRGRKGRTAKNTSPVGEAHGNAVMTSELVLRIRELHQQGLTNRQIQETIGCSNSGTISDIWKRRSWKHLP